MLGLGLSLQKGVSAFNAGRALVSSYIRRVTSDGGVLQNTACDAAAINELNQDRLLEPASWVLVPDGIKEDVVYAQKPSTGLGDLTFARASDATYTDSTGVVRRSPYNLLTFSEMFTDASWSKIAAGTGVAPSITANTSTSPTGTLTADRVQFNCTGTTLSDRSVLFQTITSAVIGRSYVFTIYIKANAPSEVGKQLRFNVDNGTNPIQVITITSDWTRYTFAAIATSTSINALLETRGTVTTNTTADVLLWGAQLVEGTSALDYFPTTNRQDVPRIDFRNADGTLSSCGRLLLEPQRTNSIRNSSMVGAVAGTPGTLPTNWVVVNAGLTQTVVGTGTENGLPYIDLRFNGTASSTEALVANEGGNTIAATSGQTWSSAIYAKTIAAPTAPNTTNLRVAEITAGGVIVVRQLTPVTLTSTLQRFTSTRTLNGGATVAFVNGGIVFELTNGAAYDFTIRIAAPQMELGAYATTWVPTTTAAVTRITEFASKTGVSSIIGQTEGTLFVEVDTAVLGQVFSSAFRRLFALSDNSISNRIIIVQSNTDDSISLTVTNEGVAQASISTAANQSGIKKIAVAYANDDFVLYVNGVQIGTDTSGTVPACSRLAIGYETTSNLSNPACPVAQAALFTTRLTNDQLEVLTSEGYGNYALLAESLNYVLQ